MSGKAYHMAESLSGAYFVDEFPVTVHGGHASFLDEERHSELNEEVYLEESDKEVAMVWDDTPLVMKVGTHHLLVHPHEEAPRDTLVIPERTATALDVTASMHPVLIAKEHRARQLVRILSGKIA